MEYPPNFCSKLPSHDVVGALGVFGYAGDGISKSIDRAVHAKTTKRIMAAKRDEAEVFARENHMNLFDANIVNAFIQRRSSSAKEQ